MRSFVQVLTTPTADTPGTTLLLHFDNKRYLVGSLGEGTQRSSVQMGARLLKVSESFITGRTEWQNVGGVIGMILTLADAAGSSKAASVEDAKRRAAMKGKKMKLEHDAKAMAEFEKQAIADLPSNALTLFSPPNMNHLLATARRFVFRKGMPLSVHEIPSETKQRDGDDEWEPYWSDQNIKVWPMSIAPSNAAKPSSGSTSRPISPRKRSIQEVYENEQVPNNGTVVADDLTTAEKNQLTVKAVVGEMFNSSWRLDTLHPTRLADVKMPAAIFIRNTELNKIEKYYGPKPGDSTPLPNPDLVVLVRKPWPGALVENLPAAQPAREAISYIIRNHLQRGKFFPQKAKDLKVPVGSKWSKLQNGEAVENEDGVMITADQVLGPSKPGGGLAVIDLPEPSYIDNLIARPEWKEPKVIDGVGAVVWICGPGVANDERVQNFMREVLPELEHVVSSPEHCPNNIALDSAAAATIRLRKVDAKRYRVPVHNNETKAPSSLPKHARPAVRGQIVQLEPSMEVHNKQALAPLDVAAVEEAMSKDVLEEAGKAQEAITQHSDAIQSWARSLPDANVEITTLGTGSALPSKYRNVSATLLRVPGWGSMLFDAGENTLGQLRRVYPPEELDQIIRDLRLIFISHMHADHHLGTVGVVKAWYSLVHDGQPSTVNVTELSVNDRLDEQNRLAIISEPAMLHWLSEYASVEDFGFSHLAPLSVSPANRARSKLTWFIPPAQLAQLTTEQRSSRFAADVCPPSLLGLQDVQAVNVQHCHGAKAVSITWPSRFKASYSGDCRPSRDFVAIGKGSTVVIHEATFDDELQGDAQAKKHSTTSEALGVAQSMGAKACVLTHFSQRYQKLPILEYDGSGRPEETEDVPMPNVSDEDMEDDLEAGAGPIEQEPQTYADQTSTTSAAGETYTLPSKRDEVANSGPSAVKFKLQGDMKVCVAFDYMRVRLGDVAEMQHFTPALLKLFAEEDKEIAQENAGEGNGEAGGKKGGKEGKKANSGQQGHKGKARRNN